MKHKIVICFEIGVIHVFKGIIGLNFLLYRWWNKIVNLSMRQLERLFKKYLFATPTKFYLNLRLVKSRQLLLQTSMSVLSIALASGFVSASHFSKCYKAYFGRSPRLERSLNNHY